MRKNLTVSIIFVLFFIISGCGGKEDCRLATDMKDGYKCDETSGSWEKDKDGEDNNEKDNNGENNNGENNNGENNNGENNNGENNNGSHDSECLPGSFQCVGNESYYCTSLNKEWVYDARCEDGCDPATGQCKNNSNDNTDSDDPSYSGNDNDPDDHSDSENDDDNEDSSDSENECHTIDGNMWSSKSSDTMYWDDAFSYCNGLNECGYSDWKLPNINDLRTLIKNCPGSQAGGQCAISDPVHLADSDWSNYCYCEKTNSGYYSKLGDNDNVWLWSSSVLSDNSDYAWYVRFGSGYVDRRHKGNDIYVRCVR